jgi:hypothetical protein
MTDGAGRRNSPEPSLTSIALDAPGRFWNTPPPLRRPREDVGARWSSILEMILLRGVRASTWESFVFS